MESDQELKMTAKNKNRKKKKKFAVNLRITKLAAATLKIPAKVATASFGLLQASKPNI
jgi:hypothetical protein